MKSDQKNNDDDDNSNMHMKINNRRIMMYLKKIEYDIEGHFFERRN